MQALSRPGAGRDIPGLPSSSSAAPPYRRRASPTLARPRDCHHRRMAGSVLVVDDNHVFRGIARRLLVSYGLDVVGEAGTVAGGVAGAPKLCPPAGPGHG